MEIKKLDKIPLPSDKKVSIHINGPAQRQLRKGHPWLFENSITKESHKGNSGDIGVIYDRKNKFLAVGIYDPLSSIRVRILQHRKPAKINRQWYLEKLHSSIHIRKDLEKSGTNGYRLVNGENDSLPGLIIDKYGENSVVMIYTTAWVKHLRDILTPLLSLIPSKKIILRMSRLCTSETENLFGLTDRSVIYGEEMNEKIVFKENNILFESDPISGQKTGFFLDQRENRERVKKLSKAKTVLNLFSYSGGFSLYSARGGASAVTDVDISKEAIIASKRNFQLNSNDSTVANCKHETITGDVFQTAENMINEKRTFDMVIVDPPNFAKKNSEIEGGLTAYARLMQLSLALLKPKGVLVFASCSSRISSNEFFKTLKNSALSTKRKLIEMERTAHSVDHPVTFDEGAYLKCLFAKVL